MLPSIVCGHSLVLSGLASIISSSISCKRFFFFLIIVLRQRGEEISLEIVIKHELPDSGWKIVSQTLKEVGMAYYEPHVHKKAFENRHTSIFVYHSGRLIGFGRAISDNENWHGEF
jgi:hypothetical protein